MMLVLFAITSKIHAQCNAPTNLTAVYNNNVSTFSWNAVPTAIDYTIEFKYPGYSWANIEYAETITDNFLLLTGIIPSGTFDWRVSANCGLNNNSLFTESQYVVPCPAPSLLNASNITTTSATLNWTPAPGLNTNVSDFVVAYRLGNTNNAWTSLGHTFVGTKNVSGLLPNTSYEWCVNQTCPYFNSSPVISQFTTLPPPCTATGALNASSIAATQATLSWSAIYGALSYSVQYKLSNSNVWSSPISVNNNNHILIGLASNKTYNWIVTTHCNGGSFVSGTATFTTSNNNSCGTPTGIASSNVLNTSASISWSSILGATSYGLRYRKSGVNTWTTISNIVNLNYTLSNLQTNTLYQYQIRSFCGNGNSNYSSSLTFTTQNCVSSGNNTNEWIDFFSLGDISRVSGADAGGYVNTALMTELTIGSIGNVGQLSGGFSAAGRYQSYAVYIDFNNNGNFLDAGEQVVPTTWLGTSGIVNFTLNIPANATAGVRKMRVIMRKNAGPAMNGCLLGFEGETEDYLVDLVSNGNRQENENNTIQEEIKNELVIYPNPSAGIFSISFSVNTKPQSYEVLTMNGALIQRNQINESADLNIDISDKPAGLYIFKIIDQSGKQQYHKLQKL